MTTYVYETIPDQPGVKPRYFEIKQGMKDAALTQHPETGEPIRRVVLGGFGVLVGPPRETAARYGLPDVTAVLAWLEQLEADA